MRIDNESQVTECRKEEEHRETRLQEEVVNWTEEHRNLCAVVTSLIGGDAELQRRVRSTLTNSLEKGRILISALTETNSRSLTGSGESPVRRTSGPIPLSGFKRFDESGVTVTGRATVRPPSSAVPSTGVAGFINPLPSRTYLKKSIG